MSAQEYIYVLELNDGKYYVGRTRDIAKRFNEHKNLTGSAWTKQNGGCKIVEIHTSESIFDEDKYTLQYMNAVGIDNVRGGSYSNCVLTLEQYNNITRALRNANNLCMTCGESDHFASVCSSVVADAYEPKRRLPKNDAPESHSNISEEALPAIKDGPVDNYSFDLDVCTRCGRTSHTTKQCYAKTNVYGKLLL